MPNEIEVAQTTKVITPLKDLVTALIEARDRIKVLDTQYEKEAEPLKEAKKAIEVEIIQTFKDRGEFSTRIEKATATLAVRKTAVVVDEAKLVDALLEQGLDAYTQVRVTDVFKESVLKDQAKELTLPGVELKETEYLSIRSNEKKEPRKVSTNEFVKIKE